MSVAPKIESSDLSIEQVYKDFYAVPDYQREYVWSEDDVERFVDDIYDEFYGPKGDLLPDAEYFIGSIVVCRNPQGVFELIDGQQRMTTVYLLLCAIRDFMDQAKLSVNEALVPMIFAPRLRDDGDTIRDHRLVLQYEDSKNVLKIIADREKRIGDIALETGSIRCLVAAYRVLLEFLEKRFAASPADVRRFFVAVVKRVKLIRIVTPNLSHALKVFETINDRGVGLTAMDLLKNLLFMRTSAEQYPRLKMLWKELVDDLDKCDEKHLRFLRYFVIASYADFRSPSGKPIREDEIYDWFVKRAGEIGLNSKPLEFAESLRVAAKDYGQFAQCRTPAGTELPFLRNMQALSGKARQHFVLMLAGRHLPNDAQVELARQIECLFFAFLIVREPTKNFESFFGDWAGDLRKASTKADVEEVVSQRFWPLMRQKSKDFDHALKELTFSRIQKYRLKYVLAKFAQHVEHLAWQGAAATQQLDHYIDPKLEVEHILSRTPSAEQRAAFDRPEAYDDWAERLGNLTLLEKPLNAAVNNGGFSEKLAAYKESKLLVTSSISGVEGYGTGNTLMKALGKLKSYEQWTSAEIEGRQLMMVKLARQIWGIDAAVEAIEPGGDAD